MIDLDSAAVDANDLRDWLINGREAHRVKVLEMIGDQDRPFDRVYLCSLIRKDLTERFKRSRASWEQDEEVASTRPWLLNALGRLVVDEDEAEEFVRENIDPDKDPDHFARCGALEGLIASGAPNLEKLVREVAEREREPSVRDPLVRMVAVAFLASRGDDDSRREIKSGLKARDLKLRWATLWALGSVPIEETVADLCEIVRNADKDSSRHLTVYRAIRALGSLPDTLRPQRKKAAAAALADFVSKRRVWPAWDEARARALTALGSIGDESIASTLTEELSDHNPAIAREAALALERVLGAKAATARVVEAAYKHVQSLGVVLTGRSSYLVALANALRWMNYASVVEELEAIMVSGFPGQQEIARVLLSELGGAAALQKLQARRLAVKDYTLAMEKAEDKIRDLFDATMKEARLGFGVAVCMDVVVFAVGVTLLTVSAWLALRNDGNLDTWVAAATGGTGVLGMLYGTLIANPRQKVQEVADHLMYLKVVFAAYLRQLHQVDQAYTRHLIEDEQSMSPEDVLKFSDMVRNTMINAVQQLSVKVAAAGDQEPLEQVLGRQATNGPPDEPASAADQATRAKASVPMKAKNGQTT
jgi:HEAT repeat protein